MTTPKLDPQVALLEHAIATAMVMHAGQMDKQGIPYILHPLRVMQDVLSHGLGYEAAIVAVLHDVMEDTSLHPDWLERKFGPVIATHLFMLTRRSTGVAFKDKEPYLEYIQRIKNYGDPCITVKVTDIVDNLGRMHTLAPLDEATAKGLTFRYGQALSILCDSSEIGDGIIENFGTTVSALYNQAKAGR